MDKYNELKQLVESLQVDVEKFYTNKNASAGTRVRKGLQSIKSLSQDIRNDITATKNADK